MFTELNAFKTYAYHVLYDMDMRPAFLLNCRGILNHIVLEDIDFEVHSTGKGRPSEVVREWRF